MINSLKDFLLNEAKQQKTQTKTDWESIFRDLRNQGLTGNDNLPAPVTPPRDEPRPSAAPDTMHARASKAKTQQRVGRVSPSAAASDMMANADLSGEDSISDEQARINAGSDTAGRAATATPSPTPTPQPNTLRSPFPATIPTTTANLPKVLSKELAKTSAVVPEWHAVKHLPGYLQSGIRSMGRSVFSSLTDTPLEEIQVLANLQDSGEPNSQEELDAVVVFLQQNGERKNELEIEFQEKIPGYQIQIRAFQALGYTFITGSDAHGKYIYSWASKENDLNKVQPPADTKRLGYDAPRLPQR
jgi:hypothetical protein